jgi:hypothetical protein
MTSVEELIKGPCQAMTNVQKTLHIAGVVLQREDLENHSLELKGRRTQTEVLKVIVSSAIEKCVDCNSANSNMCPANIIYSGAKELVVGPVTTGIGQNEKTNIGFGN